MRYYICVSLCILGFTLHVSAKKIEELKYSDGLASSFFSEFTVDQVAEQLIKRVSKERDQSGGEFDYRNHSEILIAFYEKSLQPILKSGCFYNAHQLGTGTYTFQENELRAHYEDQYIDLDLSKNESQDHKHKIERLRPKFAFMQHSLKSLPQGKIVHSYGSILGKVRDSIKSRSTFSLGDQERENGYHNVYTFSHTGRVVDKRNKPDIYWEAHIWGELCLDNIEYYLVNCPGFKPISQSSLKLMLSRDNQVYTCKLEEGLFKKDLQITSSNVTKFKLGPDNKNPRIQNIKISKPENSTHYDVEFTVSDDSLSFCEVNVHLDKHVVSQEMDINPNQKKAVCKWKINSANENIRYVEMVVRDAFGNKQTQIYNRIPKIHLP